MGANCCNDTNSPSVIENSAGSSSNFSDTPSDCKEGCCGPEPKNPTANVVEFEKSVESRSSCCNPGAEALTAISKDTCCCSNTKTTAEQSGCCGAKNADAITSNKPSCCSLTEKCDDDCVIFAASLKDKPTSDAPTVRPSSQQSNCSQIDSALKRYKALLNSARCICQSVLEEKGVSCCEYKKTANQPIKPKSGCCSGTKVDLGRANLDPKVTSDSCSSKPNTDENTGGFKAQGCSANSNNGKIDPCGTEGKSQSGCCSKKTNITSCSSAVEPSNVKKSGCCSSSAKLSEVEETGCCSSTLNPSDNKKAGCCTSTLNLPHDMKSRCCSSNLDSSDVKKAGCCSSAANPSDIKKSGCCSSATTVVVSKTGTFSRVRATRNADPESDAGFEHVALSVEGMTCNDCAEKLAKTLNAIPGAHDIRVNFVRGQADFDIEQSLVSVDSVLSKARAATGFIIHRIKQGTDETLHLLVSGPAVRALSELDIEGLTDVAVISKTTVSVDYDPTVIGARDLLKKIGDLSQGLAPSGADPAVSGGRRKYQKLLGMTVASIVFTIPVVTLAWGDDLVSEYTRAIVSFALGSVVQLLAVPVFYQPALRALIVYHSLELDMLVVVSITAAYLYSTVAFGFRLARHPLKTAEFFETSTLLITLVMLGRLLASYARIRAVAAVSMRSLQSTTALLVHEDGKGEEEIDSRLLQYGDLFKVLPHCRVPTDGVVIDGVSDVDESMLTGESIPVVKRPGSNVIAGTVNSTGTLLVRLLELPGKNTVMDIARMVDEASNSKPRVQDLADHVASYFLPVVSATALAILIIWIIVGLKIRNYAGGEAVAVAVTYAIAVLAVTCPCAVGLAVPMVLVIAGGIAARGGVIIKSAECTERSRKVTDVVFDKTGTLTEPNLDVIDEDLFCNDRDEVASVVKAMVSESKHPVSMAVAKYLGDATGSGNVSDLQSIPGSGVEARRDGALFRAGNAQWTGHQEHPTVQKFLQSGLTVLLVTRELTPVALFGLRTRVRPEAAKVITELKRRGITVHLVSGDQRRAVDAIASAVGIDSANAVYHYTPEQKQKYVAALMDDHKYVLFCGDGTNDAVAVAQAHIGAQISDSVASSDVTGGAADVVLLSGLNGIPFLLDVSKASYRRIVFNFVWSAVYNVFAILLAGGAFVKIRIPPAYAGAGEMVSVLPVIAVAMSMLLLKLKP